MRELRYHRARLQDDEPVGRRAQQQLDFGPADGLRVLKPLAGSKPGQAPVWVTSDPLMVPKQGRAPPLTG